MNEYLLYVIWIFYIINNKCFLYLKTFSNPLKLFKKENSGSIILLIES